LQLCSSFSVAGDTVLLRNKCSQHKDGKSVEIHRAKDYSKKFLPWLELMVLGSMGFTKSDQTGLWKNQSSAQASIRNDDLRCTPSGRIEQVYDPQRRAPRTQRHPHQSSAHQNSATTMDLFEVRDHRARRRLGGSNSGAASHGARRRVRYRRPLGRMTLPSRHGWAQSPPDGPSDTCYIRRSMLEFSETLGSKDPRKFSPQEVIELRCLGSKATLISLATHLEIDQR
jgi:hypothetical protein